MTKKHVIKGLYRVDEKKFKSLSNEDVLLLNECEGIAIIFAHFFSVENIYVLNQLFLGRESDSSELKKLGDSIFEEKSLIDFDFDFD